MTRIADQDMVRSLSEPLLVSPRVLSIGPVTVCRRRSVVEEDRHGAETIHMITDHPEHHGEWDRQNGS